MLKIIKKIFTYIISKSSNYKFRVLPSFIFIQDSVEGMLTNNHALLQFVPIKSNHGHSNHMLCEPLTIFTCMFKH